MQVEYQTFVQKVVKDSCHFQSHQQDAFEAQKKSKKIQIFCRGNFLAILSIHDPFSCIQDS